MKRIVLALTTIGLLAPACSTPINGIVTSDERRIWVIRSSERVFRCADTSPPDQPPHPVCVLAPFVASP